MTFMAGETEIVSTNTYLYNRDEEGTLTSMKVEYKDNTGYYVLEPIDVVYDSRGRISKLIEYSDGKQSVAHILKYNSDGLISEHVFDNIAFPEYGVVFSFKYNGMEQVKQITMKDSGGGLIYDKIYENVGKMNSNESYLVSKGLLPFDILYGEAFAVYDGGVGTVIKSYGPDQNGQSALRGTLKTKSVSLNEKGYPQTINLEDNTGALMTVQYAFDCKARN